jgi:uncharacterized protein
VEVAPGVFVSSLSTEDWETDPEVGGQLHEIVAQDDGYAGLSRFDESAGDPGEWTVPHRQVLLVLEGRASIDIDGGPTLDLGVGDIASLPAGAKTTWRLTKPYREIWFFPQRYEPG